MKIDMTFTTGDGCKITVKGSLSIRRLFSGTVSFAECDRVDGSVTFRSLKKETAGAEEKGLYAVLDRDDPLEVSKITWHGDSRVAALLNAPAVNNELCKKIRNTARLEVPSKS